MLKLRDITPYAMQTVALKALSDFLDSDLFYDYQVEGYETQEILETFTAETEEMIKQFKEEIKK